MKTEDLKAQGLTDEQISFVMSENGKDIGKIQKKLDDMTADRDKEKSRADTAEETLKGFDGVDVEKLNTSIKEWKEKAETAEREYQEKLAERDFNDLLKDSISRFNGLNEKAIIGCLDIQTLKASKNQKEDIDSAIKALTEAEDSKMLFGNTKPVPQFTRVSKGNGEDTVTKESIMQIKDRTERLNAIAQNRELFGM